MMKSYDISFALKQRVQADGGAVERDMDPAKKVELNTKYRGGISNLNLS